MKRKKAFEFFLQEPHGDIEVFNSICRELEEICEHAQKFQSEHVKSVTLAMIEEFCKVLEEEMREEHVG